MEVLFHDEEGDYIHATILKKDIVKYREILQEGKLFEIKNFMAATNYYVYKITQHEFMIKFNYKTQVKEIHSIGFPLKMFRLKSFISLEDPADVNDKELIDVIGRLIEIYNPMDKIIGGKATRLIDFQIEDNAENTLTCTLWNGHVSSLMPYYNSDSKEPLIVVIQCCRAKVVSGEVRITSSYDATKLWFNEDFEEFLEFKSKLKFENTLMRSLSTDTLHSHSTGISDFKNASVIVTNCYDLKKIQEDGEYYVAAEILGLDCEDGWYYVSCMSPDCNKKLKEDGGSLICTKCHKPYTQGTVRYKVVVIALDKSGDVPLLLWDREVAELVGIPASILYQKYKEVDVEVPPELDAIVGMKMLFKIGFKQALKRGNNYPFNVLRLVKEEQLLKTYSDRFVEHQEQDLMSRMIEEETNTNANSEVRISN
ncbi:PREDICTED: replication factor A protein 1-like [Ipomoea nil]|uniref:replication factor A protein 1-like n=1 Tax=Ipomoea nil TaxID=35883 RepID=UPI0009013289|nr:PREDICTED: replication factor A protein 1-like [Ipomoea nil]